MRERKVEDYLFCLLVGSLYLFAVNRSILASTIIQVSATVLYLQGLAALAFFMVIFLNRISMLVTGVVLLLAGLWAWLTLTPQDVEPWLAYANELFLLVRGLVAYQPDYGQAVAWIICILTGCATVIFMFSHYFFYALSLMGVSTFVINWFMNYRRDDEAFWLFLFCFFLLLIRKMNAIVDRKGRSVLSTLLALPICALALGLALHIPGQGATLPGEVIARALEKPLARVNEVIFLAFNPKYFSFQSTGFTRADNRMGGPVAVNDRNVMAVQAPGRVYLSGVTKNRYTGEAWADTLAEGALWPDGRDAGLFEFMETASALMRDVSFFSQDGSYSEVLVERLLALFPLQDRRYLAMRMFPFLNVNTRAGNPDRDDWFMSQFRLSLGYIFTYLPVDTLQIYTGTNRTGTIFRPSKGRDLTFDAADEDGAPFITASASGDLSAAGLLPVNTQYRFHYLNVEPRLTFVGDMLRRSRRGVYAEAVSQGQPSTLENMNDIFLAYYLDIYPQATDIPDMRMMPAQPGRPGNNDIEVFLNTLEAFRADTLAAYADRVYAHYTALPDTLPQRVYDLAEEITKEAGNDYDRVKAIESYLLQFPYTLTPVPVPDGADFVDHFLFEGREGYCTYYASAMAVLSRCLGIPSRYVEGYLLPSKTNAEGLYEVTNRQAHAWVEVYLEGYGWLNIEATAPYHYVAAVSSEATPSASQESLFTPSFMEDPNYQDHLRNIGFDDEAIQNTLPTPPAAVAEAEEAAPPSSFLQLARRVISVLAGLFIFFGLPFLFIMIQTIREALRRKRVSRMAVNEQAQLYYKAVLNMTTYYHYPFKAGETPLTYAARLGKRFAFKSDSLFIRDLTKLYYKAKYGSKPLSAQELAVLRDCYEEMLVFLRNVRTWPRFLYLRYLRRVTRL